jgi:hypothetical protein
MFAKTRRLALLAFAALALLTGFGPGRLRHRGGGDHGKGDKGSDRGGSDRSADRGDR